MMAIQIISIYKWMCFKWDEIYGDVFTSENKRFKSQRSVFFHKIIYFDCKIAATATCGFCIYNPFAILVKKNRFGRKKIDRHLPKIDKHKIYMFFLQKILELASFKTPHSLEENPAVTKMSHLAGKTSVQGPWFLAASSPCAPQHTTTLTPFLKSARDALHQRCLGKRKEVQGFLGVKTGILPKK